MAFNANGMQIGRSTFYDQTTGDMLTSHTYKSQNDSIATIVANGYFPDNFGGSDGQVLLGDIVEIFSQLDLVTVFYQVVTPAPLTLANLINFSADVSGPGASTDNAVVRWNGTDGTSIQNSNLIIDDVGNVTIFPSANLLVSNIDTAAPGVMAFGPANCTEFVFNPFALFQNGIKLFNIDSDNSNPLNICASLGSAVNVTPVLNALTGVTFPTTGGTKATLDFYETGTFNVTWTGALTSTETVTFLRIGKLVTLSFPQHTQTTAANATATASAAVPARLRPALTSAQWSVRGEDNGSSIGLTFVVASSGNLTVGVGVAISAFTNATTGGYFDTSLTYLVA